MTTELSTSPPANPIALLATMDLKAMDPDKMGQLLDLQAKWEDRQAEKELANALAEFQRKSPSITKTRKSNNGLFASLDDIMFAIRESLADNGLSVSFDTEIPAEGKLSVTCHILHSGGARFSREVTVPVDSVMRVNDTQKMGSAISYAKRYAIVAALNLIVSDHEDDDGNSGGSKFVSIEEIAEINRLLDALPDRETRIGPFLEWLGVEVIGQIPAERYQVAISQLKKAAKK